jgi:Ricin-type beta-trefoil lectin domain-like
MPTLATIATLINGSLMDVPDSKFVAHEHVQIYPKNSPVTLNQKWTIVSSLDGVPVPPGYVNIFAGDDPSNHLCLDIPDSNTTPGTLVQLYPVDKPGGARNQQWKYISVRDNRVYIASALNEKLVLDLRGGGATPHTLIQIYDVGDMQPNQIWYLDPA